MFVCSTYSYLQKALVRNDKVNNCVSVVAKKYYFVRHFGAAD